MHGAICVHYQNSSYNQFSLANYSYVWITKTFFVFPFKVSAENLTGLRPAITHRVVFDGGVFIGPIFGDMLATPNNFTQV